MLFIKLRGKAEARQVKDAKVGLQHNLGLGKINKNVSFPYLLKITNNFVYQKSLNKRLKPVFEYKI